MHIEVSGCPDEHFIPFIEQALEYYASELIKDKRTRNSVTIYVTFIDDHKYLATASIRKYNSRKKPREFDIELYRHLGSRRIFECLAHEMVHVKQYIFEELNESMTIWKGKKIDAESIDYYHHPWELEALAYERGLWATFVEKYKLWECLSDLRDPTLPIQYQPIAWK